jgi:hypothetical protein
MSLEASLKLLESLPEPLERLLKVLEYLAKSFLREISTQFLPFKLYSVVFQVS